MILRSSWTNLLFLFGWCFLLSYGEIGTITPYTTAINSTTSTANYGSGNTTSTTSTTSVAPINDPPIRPICSSNLSPMPGTVLKENQRAVIRCQCLSPSELVQACPSWVFLKGEEYVFVEEEILDSSSDSICSTTFQFRPKSDLKVGRRLVELACYMHGISGSVAAFDVIIDSPLPNTANARARFSIYMILAIVAFLFLTFSMFGFFFRWQIKSRRRAQRSAMFLNPFLQSQTNHQQVPFTPVVNPGFQNDNPPSYVDATQVNFQSQPPLFSAACIDKDNKAETKEKPKLSPVVEI